MSISAEHLADLEKKLGAIDSEYTPRCTPAAYGSGCPGADDASVAFWRAAVDCLPPMIAEIRQWRSIAERDHGKPITVESAASAVLCTQLSLARDALAASLAEAEKAQQRNNEEIVRVQKERDALRAENVLLKARIAELSTVERDLKHARALYDEAKHQRDCLMRERPATACTEEEF